MKAKFELYIKTGNYLNFHKTKSNLFFFFKPKCISKQRQLIHTDLFHPLSQWVRCWAAPIWEFRLTGIMLKLTDFASPSSICLLLTTAACFLPTGLSQHKQMNISQKIFKEIYTFPKNSFCRTKWSVFYCQWLLWAATFAQWAL